MIRLALLLCAILLAACTRPAAEKKSSAVTAAPPAAVPLEGGDARAWLGTLGDHADSNRCRARLKLPLAEAAAWKHNYTSAEFSAFAPSAILHFDGTLVVGSRSAQLMLLEPDNGNVLVNRDVYHREDTGSSESEEYMERFYIAPSGRLTASDNTGRLYCFDLPQLTGLWNHLGESARRRGAGALVADAGTLYTSAGQPGTRHFYALDLESGAKRWRYPIAVPDSQGMGITLSRSGVLLCYARPNQLRAVQASSGQGLWTVGATGEIMLAPVDEQRGTVHLLLRNESVECRDLASGAPLWRFSWADLMTEAKREQLNVQSGRSRFTQDPLLLDLTAYCIDSDSSYLALLSGHILRLGPDGKLVWSVKLDSAVRDMVLFDNALLVNQMYIRPDVEVEVEYEEVQPDPRDPFNLQRPNWQLPRHGEKTRGKEPKPIRHQAWTRVAALAKDNGAILSTVEPETIMLSNACPAGGKVVYGGDRAGSGLREGTHYVTAFDWVEP